MSWYSPVAVSSRARSGLATVASNLRVSSAVNDGHSLSGTAYGVPWYTITRTGSEPAATGTAFRESVPGPGRAGAAAAVDAVVPVLSSPTLWRCTAHAVLPDPANDCSARTMRTREPVSAWPSEGRAGAPLRDDRLGSAAARPA
jgi:hypothetical protein